MRIMLLLLIAALMWGSEDTIGIGLGATPASSSSFTGVLAPANGGSGTANTGALAWASGGGTAGLLDAAQLWTGVQTFELPVIADSTDHTKTIKFKLSSATAGTALTFSESQTSSHQITIPTLSSDDTMPLLGITNAWTGANSFTGTTTFATGTITANTPAITITQTWNNGSAAFDALTITITDTASSDVNSNYIHLLNGATTLFKVNGFGTTSFAGNLTTVSGSNFLVVGSTGVVSMNTLNYYASTPTGSVACVLTPTSGPTGANTAVQGWLTIQIAGVSHFIPFW